MKAIRTREEGLEKLRVRQRKVSRALRGAEKRLQKMTAEGKALGEQMYRIGQLKAELQRLNTQIASETAGLPCFRRRTARQWMSLKFGGLMEFVEKGAVCKFPFASQTS